MTPPALITVTLTTANTSSGRRFYYLVAYRSTGGKRERRKLRTGTTVKAVAEKQKRALELRIAAGFDPFAPVPDVFAVGPAVAAFLDDCRSRGLRPKTVYVYESVLRIFEREVGANVALDAVTLDALRRFCVQPHLSDASRHNRLRHVRAFFEWAVRSGWLTDNPAAAVRLPRAKRTERQALTPADVERILTAIDSDLAGDLAANAYERAAGARYAAAERAGYWLRPMVEVVACLGLRRGEAIRLRWRDVDLDNERLHVRASKAGDRAIPIPPVLLEVFARLRDRDPRSGDPSANVFRSSKDGPLDGGYVSRTFSRYCKLAGLRVTRFHALRHGAATYLISRGTATATVQKILGHSSISVTEGYLHLEENAMRDALDRAYGGEE